MGKMTRTKRVRDRMTADPMTVASNAPLVEAAKILETYRISALPVVDEHKLVGILYSRDQQPANRRSLNEQPNV